MASCAWRSSRSSFRLSAWLRRRRKLSHARAVTFVRSARSRTASGHARSRDRGNSRSCHKRRRRWISRRRAMLRCRHLRRRPARSFASARLSSPCGRAVVAVITPPRPLLSVFCDNEARLRVSLQNGVAPLIGPRLQLFSNASQFFSSPHLLPGRAPSVREPISFNLRHSCLPFAARRVQDTRHVPRAHANGAATFLRNGCAYDARVTPA